MNFIGTTFMWLDTYLPHAKRLYKGLNNYGLTVIQLEHAAKAHNFFEAWVQLFQLGSETLFIGKQPVWENGNAEPNLVETLADYCQKIIDSEGQFFILHEGL